MCQVKCCPRSFKIMPSHFECKGHSTLEGNVCLSHCRVAVWTAEGEQCWSGTETGRRESGTGMGPHGQQG